MKKILKISLLSLISAVVVVLTTFFVKWQSYKAIVDTGLPRIDVYTENKEKIVSREEYVNCSVSLSIQ